MRMDVQCLGIVQISSVDDIVEFLDKGDAFQILGGGSNILFTKDVEGYVLHNCIQGIQMTQEDADHVYVKVGGGELWHDFVTWSVEQELSGIENLALIPGTVGAAPIQNIGAYGVEQCDAFVGLDAIRLSDGTQEYIDKESCRFGYRESIFKHEAKGSYFITHVHYALNKEMSSDTSYGRVLDEVKAVKERSGRANLPISPRDVYEAIIHIRQTKLPDPNVIFNTGSFFKNPMIATEDYERLKSSHPSIPCYPVSQGIVKIPAAWLIEQSGLKGYRDGDAGVYENHALVLVNHGNASGDQMRALAHLIQETVAAKFGVRLEAEVNIW